MTTRYASGTFIPKNEKKYIGKSPIIYRSGWEREFMNLLDAHPAIIQWASESVTIPYYNPVSRKDTIYVPDFLIIYMDKNGKLLHELVEIKPRKESLMEAAKTTRAKLIVAINHAKWAAARKWCAKNGFKFSVKNEQDLFRK